MLDDQKKYQVCSPSNPRVQKIIEHYSRYPLHSVWLKTAKNFFSSDLGVVAFESVGRANVVAGDPLALIEGDEAKLLDQFVNWSRSHNKYVCGYYFSKNLMLNQNHFEQYHAGVSRLLNLSKFSIDGYESRDIRRALNHGRRNQLLFTEVNSIDKPKFFAEVKSVERQWFENKKQPRISFLLSHIKLKFPESHLERWFVVQGQDSELQAFVSILPYGNEERPSYYVDQLIQSPTGDKLALDYLLAKIILQLAGEGVVELSLGFNAFQKVKPAKWIEKALWLNQFVELLYKSRGLYNYKRKFSCDEHERFILLDKKAPKLRQLHSLFKVTYPGLKRAH